MKKIPARVSIRERPAEADVTRFGDWEMDTKVEKDGKGAIVTLTERRFHPKNPTEDKPASTKKTKF